MIVNFPIKLAIHHYNFCFLLFSSCRILIFSFWIFICGQFLFLSSLWNFSLNISLLTHSLPLYFGRFFTNSFMCFCKLMVVLFSSSFKASFGSFVGSSFDLSKIEFSCHLLSNLLDLFSCKQSFRSIIEHITTTVRGVKKIWKNSIKATSFIIYIIWNKAAHARAFYYFFFFFNFDNCLILEYAKMLKVRKIQTSHAQSAS